MYGGVNRVRAGSLHCAQSRHSTPEEVHGRWSLPCTPCEADGLGNAFEHLHKYSDRRHALRVHVRTQKHSTMHVKVSHFIV